MAEIFDINVKPTAAESPRPNGMVEQHNAILAKTIEKLILEHNNKYPIDVIIAWAVNAKNSLHNSMVIAQTNEFLDISLVYHFFNK